jgi:ribosomal protein S18 acetylase RimI-like enzyme
MESCVQIAPFSEQDIAPCAHIMAGSEPWTRYGVTAAAAGDLWRSALRDAAAVSVARLDGRTVGFAWYIPGGGFGLSGYLKLLGVDATVRGKGAGTALLEHIERRTLEDGQVELFLLVSDFNVAAQRFYRRHGYAEVGTVEDYVIPGITELIYRKQLRPRG